MRSTTLSEARRRLPELVDLAVAGVEILLTRRGQSVARLSGISSQIPQLPSGLLFREQLLAQGLKPSKDSAVTKIRQEER
ncbi:MAG: type II toxin-antitoxin system prevent-host-death family antitoxin [Fibrobacterota bacterium]|nr:MAG: type II toxin-antitoxin system prevent-host-death family antitoxin [Fibrobacterota bacterium]